MKPVLLPFPLPARVCLALLSAYVAGPAMAATVSFNGDTTGAPTFQRPVEDLSALSAIGTAAHYTSYAFTALASGTHTFTTRGAFDTFVLLYDAPFAPTMALLNALIANDDLTSAAFNVSGFSVGLQAGRQYTYVVTGFDNSEFGAYTTTIDSPDVTAVPEPATWALVAVGLLVAMRRPRAATQTAQHGDRT